MLVVDCHVHLHNRTYWEAHVNRCEPPTATRSGDGYVFTAADRSRTVIRSSHYQIEEQMRCFEAHGIDMVVSSMGDFTVDHLSPTTATALAMKLNEERAELEDRYPGRYYGLALIPMQDAQAAITTLDHAVRTLGLRGVCIGSNVNGESIAADARHPVYRRIEELGVPIFLHPTAAPNRGRKRRNGDPATAGATRGSSCAALDLILSGVLDRHPTLRVVDPHLGGFLPHLAASIERNGDDGVPGTRSLRHPIREYLNRFYADTATLDPDVLRHAVDIYGADHLLYASDYPRLEPSATLDLVRRELSGDVLERVLFENAAALLGLTPP